MNKDNIKGQATLEFALVLPMVIIFILVVSQFGHMVFVQNVIEQASREAARIAATTNDVGKAKAAALNICSALNREDVSVEVIPKSLSSLSIGDFVTVKITYRYGGIANVIEALVEGEAMLKSKSMMRMECENKEGMYH